jgi:hypothetical protein
MSKARNKTKPSERIFPRNPHYTDNDLDHSLLGPCKSGRSEENVSSICTEDIGDVVKGQINRIANTNYTNEQQRKNAYNAFYKKLLDSKGDCTELRILAKKTDGTNVHLWTKDQYTPEIAKMYNILTSSLAVLCNSSDSCNFEEMKALQLEILRETNKLVIEGLGNIDMELNNTIRMIDSENDDLKAGASLETEEGASETEEGASETEEGAPVLRNLAAIFGASYEFINNTIITPANVEVFAGIINKMITIMKKIQSSIVEEIRRTSNISLINTFFGALDCYNRFLISAIGNKLTTILNSITIAGLTLGGAGFIAHAALVDTLNEQNLLQSAATLYYSSQFINPTMKTLSAAVGLGDSIKIYLMKTFPKALEKNINTVTESIKKNIDDLAKQTEGLDLKVIKRKIENITDFAQRIKNNEELLMTDEDRALLESYLNENAEQAGLKEDMNVEGEEEKEYGGGKKHKKSHKKRHQKTHKKQLKPKAKSHKKKNKPKAKSHKKK